MKLCTRCGEEKPPEDFYRHATTKDGLRSECKDCCKRNASEWQKNNRGRRSAINKRSYRAGNTAERQRRQRQKRIYGVTDEQLDAEVVCHICGKAEDLHWDHDHETGVTRGRLCGTCNRGLGMFKDRVALLQNAIDYLEKRR